MKKYTIWKNGTAIAKYATFKLAEHQYMHLWRVTDPADDVIRLTDENGNTIYSNEE